MIQCKHMFCFFGMVGLIMMFTYLEKYKDELLEQKATLLKDITSCDNEIKETTKFIEYLEESSDPNYEAFTPRKVNMHHKDKIEELKTVLKESFAKKESLQNNLSSLDERIEELNSVIRNSSDHYLSKEVYQQSEAGLNAMIHKFELCSQLVDVDPIRCKQELAHIESMLKSLYKDMFQ